MRILKHLLRPIWIRISNAISTIELLKNNPTLKLGMSVTATASKFGHYVYLATGTKITNSYLGDFTYCSVDTKLANVHIGKFTCIGPKVMIGMGQHPIENIASIHPAFYSTAARVGKTFVREQKFFEDPPRTNIGNDVWIGAGVIIPGGISIGDGAVIAAGAVVVRDVGAYEIVGGVPAKVIRSRFKVEISESLQEMRWWNWPVSEIHQHADKFIDVQELIAWENKRSSKVS